METMGERLRKLRTQKGLTQKQVSEFIGIPASTYRDWEYGKQIKGEPYEKLAVVLDVTISQLITGRTLRSEELIKQLDYLDEHIKIIRKTVASL